MTWWLKDFDLLSVLLRASMLALESLATGGVLFILLAGRHVPGALCNSLRSFGAWSAAALAAAIAGSTALGATLLVAGSGLPFASVRGANFFLAGEVGFASAAALAAALRLRPSPAARSLWALLAGAVMAASVSLSHAASRLGNRRTLLVLTLAHHLGTALWIGAMPFLLLALRGLAGSPHDAARVARGYSRMALVGLPMLLLAGVGLSWVYIGSPAGLYGSSYGVMVMAKTSLLLLAGALGWTNQRLLASPDAAHAGLLRLRRLGEVEIGLGFTAVLAAASLTSQAPAVDLPRADLVSAQAIVERFRPVMPRLSSPPLAALAPPTSLEEALRVAPYGSGSNSDSNDKAWSEYNHHWAGLIVLAAALLALLSRGSGPIAGPGAVPGAVRGVARQWPLLFLGLAAFVLLRADPENWPLGPRSFWGSFSAPDVLEHRLYALLIAGFALFEWRVERVGSRAGWQAYVFPLVCAVGGAALLTHSHGAGDPHEELLAELSHTPIAILGATAGWGRWLELRLPGSRAARWAGYIWPACLLLAGAALLDYRES